MDLMSDKVRILREEYLSKRERGEEVAVQTDLKVRQSFESKPTQDCTVRLEEKNRIIKVYEELLTKLRKKLNEKTF